MAKSQISLGQLPLTDIDAYLQIVSGYTKKTDKAVDTKHVADVDASMIAIAALDINGDLAEDRFTVDNSLKLNGKDASKYLLKDDSESLLSDTYAVSRVVSSELKAVRDELYQMKAELSKAGLIKQGNVYNGFYDAFRNNEIRYDNSVVTKILSIERNGSSISSVIVEDSNNLHINQYISFKTSTGLQASKIISKTGSKLTISPQVSGELVSDKGIYKTCGTYNKGSFVFGEKSSTVISDEIYKVIIKDGNERKEIKTLNYDVKGFATKCCKLYSVDGYLTKMQLSLGAIGNPGNIKIVLYKILNEETMELEEISSSNPISSSEVTASLNNITFSFNDAARIYRNEDYLVFIKAEGVDNDNRWRIGGYEDPCTDTCLCCSGDTFEYIGSSLQPTASNNDIYLAFFMSEVVDNEVTYLQRGVYTCSDEVKDGFTRVRVELKINKEGLFYVADNNTKVCNETNILQLKSDNSYEGYTLFSSNQEIVVGDSIANVGTTVSSNTRFSLKQDTYTPVDAEVYRNGYKIVATVKNKVIDLANITNPLSYKDLKVVELPLIGVMKGKEFGKDASSDRLIFEAEVGTNNNLSINTLDLYDTFEIQIYWANNSSAIRSENLAGIIYDLSISTDRAYNKIM